MERIRAHLIVSGRVQEVFYRVSAQKEAQKLGVAGWIKNLADGRVEIIAEGTEKSISQFISWAKRGPVLARVTSVEVVYEEYTGELKGFEVL